MSNPLYKNFTIAMDQSFSLCLDKKMVIYLSSINGKEVSNTFAVSNNSTRQLFLYYKISFCDTNYNICLQNYTLNSLKGAYWIDPILR